MLEGTNGFAPELITYIEHYNRDHVLILNIESVAGLDNLERIVNIPGIDAILIGPHDLSTSLGIPEAYDHPYFDQAVRRMISLTREKGVGVGIHYWANIDQEIDWARHGANLLVHSGDILLFVSNLRQDLEHIRNSLGEEARAADVPKPGAI